MQEIKADFLNIFFRNRFGFRKSAGQFQGRINIAGFPGISYGNHRSGWNYAMRSISILHNPSGILFDPFIERTFAWNPKGIRPHQVPWVGFIHVPPCIPSHLPQNQSNKEIFNSAAWRKSLPFCKGLFTLSAYHKLYLETILKVPVNNLLHPTEFPQLTWSSTLFHQNKEKKIIQIGWWLRKIYSIHRLRAKGYQKIFLMKNEDNMDEIMKRELEHTPGKEFLTPECIAQTKTMKFIPNKQYDRLLSENIVFLDLYDASANNTIVECIARNTPILVNPIAPVVEYLGIDYPLYFTSLEEAAEKIGDTDMILRSHHYLANHKIKAKLTGDYFRQSLLSSAIYQSL
ncbi:MAG: hypothetical protein NT004_09515 [Bacteroidetes bacterium]|nr:hypothetical protein [Bacteroidota bacterium]